jgi:DNA-binding transcriptional LysR family regulator
MATRHKMLLEILQTNIGVSLLPEKLVDSSLFPKLRIIPLKESISSKIALVKAKKNKLNEITTQFWKYWQKNCSLK